MLQFIFCGIYFTPRYNLTLSMVCALWRQVCCPRNIELFAKGCLGCVVAYTSHHIILRRHEFILGARLHRFCFEPAPAFEALANRRGSRSIGAANSARTLSTRRRQYGKTLLELQNRFMHLVFVFLNWPCVPARAEHELREQPSDSWNG